jgi:integrase
VLPNKQGIAKSEIRSGEYDFCPDLRPRKGRGRRLVRIARGLYRYGPTGIIYWCRKLKGQNVWTNLQTTDLKRAMAITALCNYAGSQNGNHEFSVVSLGSDMPKLTPRRDEPLVVGPVPVFPAEQTVPPATSPPSGFSLNDVADRFRAESKHLAESTRKTMECLFRMAQGYLSFDRDVREIRISDLRKLKGQLSEGHKPSTVNDVIFKGLGALFSIAVEDGHIDRSPLERLKRTRNGEPERQQPTWEQSLQILELVTRSVPETGVIVGFMRYFGVGQAEIMHLKGEHIDRARGKVHFRRKKTGKPFDVPIFPHAKPFIESLAEKGVLITGKPVATWRNPRKALESASKELDLPVYSPRALRRTFIIHCLEMGIDPRVVADWQGHKDATLIFRIYGKYISSEHAAKMAQMLTA